MKASRVTLFRRAPHLVLHLERGRSVVHNYASGQRAAAQDVVVAALLHFDEWRPVDASLFARLDGWSPREARALVREMVRLTLLHRSDRPPREPSLGSWGDWDPVASYFHFATRDTFRAHDAAALDAEDRRLRRKGRRQPPPAPVKRYPRAEALALPATPLEGEFAEVLLGRRTWRGFGRGRVALADLAAALDLGFGVQRWGRAGVRDRVAFKTSPSAGARHPIEAYVLALRVQGLKRGLYHYAADERVLERLRSGATPTQVEDYLAGQWWFKPAAALVLMTAVLPRTRWRYDYARAYRSVLAEVGHVCQSFCLAATWRGLAPFSTMALDDSRVERALGIDGVDEVLLYAAGVGPRPPGKAWVQWPDHAPGHPHLPPGL